MEDAPIQWFHGIQKHPLIDLEEVPPSLQRGSDFEEHIMGRSAAGKAFHEAEAKTLLRLATHARSRTLRNPQLGQSVYYFRRGKGSKKPGYLGPAKVIAIEPSHDDTLGSSVIWLSHAATLVRAAPEHLRAAAPIETQVHDMIVHGSQQPPRIVPKKSSDINRSTLHGTWTTTNG